MPKLTASVNMLSPSADMTLPSVLACEAVTRAGSWAWLSSTDLLASGDIAEGRAAADLAPALHQAMVTHGCPDRLAVAVGPGSFTGLRVAVTAVRTLAWLEQLPVVAVDTLAAIAAAQGPGCWWVWLPLKKDTTFHACYRVTEIAVETIRAPQAQLDAAPPVLPAAIADELSAIIGPALATKPDLHAHWAPQVTVGSDLPCHARAVAWLGQRQTASNWSDLQVHYGQVSAAELQRQANIPRNLATNMVKDITAS